MHRSRGIADKEGLAGVGEMPSTNSSQTNTTALMEIGCIGRLIGNFGHRFRMNSPKHNAGIGCVTSLRTSDVGLPCT
eukprot:8308872-Karenia_brevis.AAC.1